MKDIFIIAAKRTPQGRLSGALAGRSASDLALAAGKEALRTVAPESIDRTIIGNVVSAGLGMNVSRQVSVKLGIPVERHAFTVNMMCASGMQSVILGIEAILSGQAHTVLCGGTESMSNAPFLLGKARNGYKLGDGILNDALLKDGLVDSFSGEHMGLAAERLAGMFGITREQQDIFALRSQTRCAKAAEEKRFADELVPMDELTADEHPRPDTSLEKLASMKPAFSPTGTITAGNASGINDGAALIVITDSETMQQNHWLPMARITAWSTVGCDPKLMGLGPVHAVRALFGKKEIPAGSIDTVELNEAFAVQALACIKELKLDPEKVNQEGGAIALGHPIGASGARLIAHLAWKIARDEADNGIAALCVGGGMGSAMLLEKA